jgi:cell division initiation protein
VQEVALTPVEISKVEFTKSFRGYTEEEVDDFIDKVLKHYEELYRENLELKDQVDREASKVEQYKNIEDTLKSTLILAQKTAEEITRNSIKEAENIVNEANTKADDIIASAKNQVEDLKHEYSNLQRQVQVSKAKFRSMLTAQLEMLEDVKE